ncbi:MAG: YkuS family protein [Alkaliphilus sp.]
MKNVVVQESLVKIKEELIKRGYEIVGSEEGKRIDAIVYEGDYETLKNLNEIGEMNHLGAVIINSKRKNIEDIVYIIERRKYENIFIKPMIN